MILKNCQIRRPAMTTIYQTPTFEKEHQIIKGETIGRVLNGNFSSSTYISDCINSAIVGNYLKENLKAVAARSRSDAKFYLDTTIKMNIIGEQMSDNQLTEGRHYDFESVLQRCEEDGAAVAITPEIIMWIVNSEISSLTDGNRRRIISISDAVELSVQSVTQNVQSLSTSLSEYLKFEDIGSIAKILTIGSSNVTKLLPFFRTANIPSFKRQKFSGTPSYCVCGEAVFRELILRWSFISSEYKKMQNSLALCISSYLDRVVEVVSRLLDCPHQQFISSGDYKNLFLNKEYQAAPINYLFFEKAGKYYYLAQALTAGVYSVVGGQSSSLSQSSKIPLFVPTLGLYQRQVTPQLATN